MKNKSWQISSILSAVIIAGLAGGILSLLAVCVIATIIYCYCQNTSKFYVSSLFTYIVINVCFFFTILHTFIELLTNTCSSVIITIAFSGNFFLKHRAKNRSGWVKIFSHNMCYLLTLFISCLCVMITQYNTNFFSTDTTPEPSDPGE